MIPDARYQTTPRSAEGRNTDTAEMAALLELGLSKDQLLALQPMLGDLEKLFGADLPADIQIQRAEVQPPALQGMAFTSSYDEGYCGHFSVPNQDGAAATFDQVMAQPQPLQFIKQNLNFGAQDNGEWVIFTPGLNTLHQVKPGWEGEQTAPQRLQEQYEPVLGIQMAHMHLGTDMDQGEAIVPLRAETRIFLEAKRPELEGAGIMPELRDDTAVFNRRQRDRIETILSLYGQVRTSFREHAVQLLEASKAAQQPIVWLAYSRSSSELCRAIGEYIQMCVQRGEMLSAVEGFLREHVTVLTIGNAVRVWPDGPAYVHCSALSDRSEWDISPPKLWGTDPLTFGQGVHARQPEGAGKDAVFLHYDGLFCSFDTHNFGTVGAAALKLIMDINGVTTFRALWERGHSLKIPSDWQIAAKVTLTAGEAWLWDKETSLGSYRLPSVEQARQILAGL